MSKSNFKKLRKSWKIEIPLSNKLGQGSIKDFNNILNKDGKYRNIELAERTVYNYIEDCKLLGQATQSASNIATLINKSGVVASDTTSRMTEFSNRKIGFENPEVDAFMNLVGRKLSHIAQQLNLEIELYSECYAFGISSWAQMIKLQILEIGKIEDYEDTVESLSDFLKSIYLARESMEDFLETLSIMTIQTNKLYNEGIKKLYDAVSQIIEEFNISIEMAESFKLDLQELGG